MRYLEPGDYTLFAHDPKLGWALEDVSVKSDVTDIGEHRLDPGGTIARYHLLRAAVYPSRTQVVATGPSGVSLTIPVRESYDRFELGGLWPGSWTITVLGGRELLATARVEIADTEEVRVDLACGNDGRP